MAYYVIDDWRGGLDHRRLPVVASPTTLWRIDNAHINPGGEIEKRKAFTFYANALNSTIGLAALNNLLVVFGTGPNPLPPDSPLLYQRLGDDENPFSLAEIEDWDLFDGLLYVVARGTDGNFYHFYNGQNVSDGIGRHIRTFGQKVYSVLDKNLHFSSTGDPTVWTGLDNGSGSINLSTRDAESLNLEGIEVYYNQLAIFSPRVVQFWSVNADETQNIQLQVLRAAGTRSGHSVKQYGGGDVLYLDGSGIRSLQARDSSNAAQVSDVGSPIDAILQQLQLDKPEAWLEARAATEQGTGRFWLHVGGEIYVLSRFPGPKVTAWSRYLPEVPARYMTSYQNTVAIRGEDNNVYIYGSLSYNQYDSAPVEVVTPFFDVDQPATRKEFESLDIAGTNLWNFEVNYRPSRDYPEEDWLYAGQYEDVTYEKEAMTLGGESTHLAYRIKCEAFGPAVLSNLTTHYKTLDAQ